MLEAEARQQTDGELVRDSLSGSEAAYAELVRRYQDLLYRHAERMSGSRDEAEDIVQLTFVRGYRSLASCRDPDRVGGWLAAVFHQGRSGQTHKIFTTVK